MKATNEYFNMYQNFLLSGSSAYTDIESIKALKYKLSVFNNIKKSIEEVILQKKFSRSLDGIINALNLINDDLINLTKNYFMDNNVESYLILENNEKIKYVNELLFYFKKQLHDPYDE